MDSNAIDFTKTGINFVGRTFENNGIQGKIQKRNFEPNKQFTITATVIGNYKYVKYQTGPYYCSQNINKLTPKSIIKKWNEKIAYYLMASLQKFVSLYDGQQGGYKLEDIKKHKIHLPTKSGKIDFEFMESFIAELEAERLAELEAYLLATGLKDYILTEVEKQALAEFESDMFEWAEFKIEDVLQWQPQKEIDPLKLEELKDETEKMYPFYGQATINNGIISYHQLTKTALNNQDGKPTILIHSNNQNIVYVETPFYLKDGHGATSVLQCENLNRINQMCIVASIDKVIKSKYSYNHKATKIELKNTVIKLLTKNNQPDYALMQTFISAIQKLVIKDVVQYADSKIAATKQVVG